ncbi:esterase family protein [bacterium]|nr:esterase family protein [bacterium]
MLYSLAVKYSLYQLALPIIPQDFVLFNLQVESKVLAHNRIGDSPRKHHFVLQSRKKPPQMVIFHLSGYFGNGPQSFQAKTLEETFVQQVISHTQSGKAPSALHVFVDAMTAWGGSQFINSDLFGRYSDHIQSELVPLVQSVFPMEKKTPWVLMGSSSGGYGALHHVSLAKSPFTTGIAIAPDSDFATSLLPELYKQAPQLLQYEKIQSVKNALHKKELQKKKNFFDIINALAMTGCYSPLKTGKLAFPIDLKTAGLQKNIWQQWLKKDPIFFLSERAKNLKKKTIYLEVGEQDEFSLYFGARKIRDVLKRKKVKTIYQEFPGGHFALNERKIKALEWLKKY